MTEFCPRCDSLAFEYSLCADCGFEPRAAFIQSETGYVKEKSAHISDRFGKPLHRIKAEKALGRPLPKNVVVHHHDENPSNNANSNLVICEKGYHYHIHHRMRMLKRGMDPDTYKHCWSCGQAVKRCEFNKDSSKYDGLDSKCKPCRKILRRAARARRAS